MDNQQVEIIRETARLRGYRAPVTEEDLAGWALELAVENLAMYDSHRQQPDLDRAREWLDTAWKMALAGVAPTPSALLRTAEVDADDLDDLME